MSSKYFLSWFFIISVTRNCQKTACSSDIFLCFKSGDVQKFCFRYEKIPEELVMLLKLKMFCLIDNTFSKWSGCKQVCCGNRCSGELFYWIFFSTCISSILQWPMPFLPMKYPEYRISMEAALPSSVHCWFKHELELLGIDSLIYTRYIISLLLQVCCFS